MIINNYLSKIYMYYMYFITDKYSSLPVYKYFTSLNFSYTESTNYFINIDTIFTFLINLKSNTIYLLDKVFNVNILNKFIYLNTSSRKLITKVKTKFMEVCRLEDQTDIDKIVHFYPLFGNKIIIIFNNKYLFYNFFNKTESFKGFLNCFKTYLFTFAVLTKNKQFVKKELDLFLTKNNSQYNIKILNVYKPIKKLKVLTNFKIKKFINLETYTSVNNKHTNYKLIEKLLYTISDVSLNTTANKLNLIKKYLTYKFQTNSIILNSLLKDINKMFYTNIENKPLSNFLLCGPSGTGKTELAKILSYSLFGSSKSLIKINMSEYMEEHSVSKLIGSPPGYVGYSEPNDFINKLKTAKNSILLFDEIEKAHKSINDLMLQILEEGKLTLSNNDILYFNNILVIFTSNLGCSTSSNFSNKDIYDFNILKSIKNFFRPEFLSRINNLIIFDPINIYSLNKILNNIIRKNCLEFMYTFNLTEEIRTEFIKYTYNNIYGVRPLLRLNNASLYKLNNCNFNLKSYNNISNSISNNYNLSFINVKYKLNSYTI